MVKNKIMILAIGIMTLGGAAGAQTLRADNGPAERPPVSFKGKQYIDSKGCVYIRAGYGERVTWVPRVNRKRQVYCSGNNKPSLNAAQLAKISGKPATRVVKPANSTVAVAATIPVKITPQIQTPLLQGGGNNYNVAMTDVDKPEQAKTSVRGFNIFQRRKNRDSLRDSNGQNIHPADLNKSQRAAGTYQQSAVSRQTKPVVRAFDPIHKLPVYPVVIDADITPRGNEQMALVWSNTVPMRLVQKGQLKLAAFTGVN